MKASKSFKMLSAVLAAVLGMAAIFCIGCNGDKGTGPGGGSGGGLILPDGEAWISLEPDNGGNVYGYALQNSGTLLYISWQAREVKWTSEVAGTYKVSGNKITVYFEDGETHTGTYTISGNEIGAVVTATFPNTTITAVRTPVDIITNSNLVLGPDEAWVIKETIDGETYEFGLLFMSNGEYINVYKDGDIWDADMRLGEKWSTNGNKLIMRSFGTNDTVTYTVSGNTLKLTYTYPGQPAESITFKKTSIKATHYRLSRAYTTGGSVSIDPDRTDIAVGTKVTVTAVPDSGYEFTRWTGADAPNPATTNPVTLTMDENKTLTANFQKAVTPPAGGQFIVAFNTDGGIPAAIASITVDSGTAIGAANFPPNPTKSGYTFAGWFSGNTLYTAAAVINEPVTLTAKWEAVSVPPTGRQFTVAFDTNGGNPAAIASVSVDSGAAIGASLPPDPTKTNYTFAGWFSGNTQYTAATVINAAVTLTAKWEAVSTQPTVKQFTVAFDTNGGTPAAIASVTVDSGAAIGAAKLPSAPTKSGYTFVGWFSGNTQYTATTVINASVTLTAKWEDVSGGEIVIGSWTWNKYTDVTDGGTSTIALSESSGAVAASGNVTGVYEYGYAGFKAFPNAAELENLKTAASISFKVKGDGKTYKIILPTSNITDFCYYLYKIETTTAEKTVTIPIASFTQPVWGVGKPFNQSLITNISWETNDEARGTFSLTISDLELIQPPPPPAVGTFTDSRDSKPYKKVTIGTQTWMAENLNYDVPDNTTDVCYENSADNCAKYGRLYDWAAAMNLPSSCNSVGCSDQIQSPHQGACPVGWHLPTDDEWTTLVDYAGGASTASKKLKSASGWEGHDGNGTDEYGFKALPGGIYSTGETKDFSSINYTGGWWSATESGPVDYSGSAWGLFINSYGNVSRPDFSKAYKESVRCVAD